MSSKSYIGTITIDSVDYDVSGVVAKRGRQVLGTLSFDLDETKTIPINFRATASGTTFSSVGTQWFQTPAEEIVALLSVSVGFTSADSDLSFISITDTPVELDGVGVTLSLSIQEVVEESEYQGLENEAEIIKTNSIGTVVPLRVNEVGNTIDHFAALLSISRNTRESNEELLRRIEFRLGRPSSSSREGLSYAIPESLNLLTEPAINITMKEGADIHSVALFLRRDKVTIYEKWIQIELQEAGIQPVVEAEYQLDGLTISNLADLINLSSSYSAKVLSNGEKPANMLLPQNTFAFHREFLKPSEKMKMKYEGVVRQYFSVEKPRGMVREVELIEDVTGWGDYFVDYESGNIYCFSQPDSDVLVGYIYNAGELELEYSPVYTLPLFGEEFNNLYFNQVEQDFYSSEDDKEVNGIPKYAGYDIIRKVMTAGSFPQFWGE